MMSLFFDFSLKIWEEINKKHGSEIAIIDQVPIDPEDTDPSNPRDNTMTRQLNTILFGPPGTGKTYNTINHALSCICGVSVDDQNFVDEICKFANNYFPKIKEEDGRKYLKSIFDECVKSGQIVFATFHQSYGYEEFIEGIKALPPKSEYNDSDQLVYDVMPGVFKRLCETAKLVEIKSENGLDLDYTLDTDAKVWKISLGGARDNDLKRHCFDDSVVRIGWENIKKLSEDDEAFAKEAKKTQTTLMYFEKEIEQGDFVVSLYDAEHIDAIGIVIGDYEWDKTYDHYPRKRAVKWLWTKKQNEDPIYFADINKKNMVQQTVYRLWNIKPSDLLLLIQSKLEKNKSTIAVKKASEDKNYVIIIDEINRGNISKIFGELITLIEPSKRLGADEAMTVKLPYSGESFGVPQNVYIIGTMNTADRSIALMDTALRRRFEFIEMMPDYSVLSSNNQKVERANSNDTQLNDLKVGDINIRLLLKKINERIAYLYDRDHQIGHAYFMSLLDGKDKDTDKKAELDNIFRNKIIPLLQEYFYDDWEKIQIVLGDHEKQKPDNKACFILSEKQKEVDVLGFNHDDIVDETISYTINETFTANTYLKITGGLLTDNKPT